MTRRDFKQRDLVALHLCEKRHVGRDRVRDVAPHQMVKRADDCRASRHRLMGHSHQSLAGAHQIHREPRDAERLRREDRTSGLCEDAPLSERERAIEETQLHELRPQTPVVSMGIVLITIPTKTARRRMVGEEPRGDLGHLPFFVGVREAHVLSPRTR